MWVFMFELWEDGCLAAECGIFHSFIATLWISEELLSDVDDLLSWHKYLGLLLITRLSQWPDCGAKEGSLFDFQPPGLPAILLFFFCNVSKGQLESMILFSQLSITTVRSLKRHYGIPQQTCLGWLIQPVSLLSLTVKPSISEAELSNQEVQPYMYGKHYQLICTAFGVPLPDVTWLWQPCHPNAMFEQWVTIWALLSFTVLKRTPRRCKTEK